MKYSDTQFLLDSISDVCNLNNCSVTTEDMDFVLLEKEHYVGLEVHENEIIVYFFKDHRHFEDYTSELEEGDTPYLQRAADFLHRLFTTPLQIMEKRKSGKLLRRELFFLLPDGRRESVDGPWLERLFSNPFVKPVYDLTNYSYHKESGQFHNVQDGTAITKVLNLDDRLLVEIHKRADGTFTYAILEHIFDEEEYDFFWTPIGTDCSLFDTEEKALQAAKDKAVTILK